MSVGIGRIGDIDKSKSVTHSGLESHAKSRGKYNFYSRRISWITVKVAQSLNWMLNDMVFLSETKGNVTGVWGILNRRERHIIDTMDIVWIPFRARRHPK